MSGARHHTAAILTYRKNRMNHRLLFGDPVLHVRRGWRRELAVFGPDQVFGYERWSANHYGTQEWRIAICRSANAGSVTRFPGICPGAIILLDAPGKDRAKRLLCLLDAARDAGCERLEHLPDHYWREHANAIEIGAAFNHERTKQ